MGNQSADGAAARMDPLQAQPGIFPSQESVRWPELSVKDFTGEMFIPNTMCIRLKLDTAKVSEMDDEESFKEEGPVHHWKHLHTPAVFDCSRT